MQFQADVLSKAVIRPKVTETTALGAAYLAGLAVGFWKDIDELKEQWSVERIFEPEKSDMQIAKKKWQQAVYKAQAWIR